MSLPSVIPPPHPCHHHSSSSFTPNPPLYRSGQGNNNNNNSNRKRTKGDVSDEFDVKLMDMYTNIYTMRQDLERLKKPIGTKDNPARSCKDLYYGHPKFKG